MMLLRLALLCSLVSFIAGATISLDDSDLAYVAGSGAVSLDGSAALSGADFSSGALSLEMTVTSGLVAGEDLLQIRAAGTVSVASGVVSVSGTPIGSYSGGGGGTPLTVTITPGSDATAVETLIQALAYHNLAGSGATTGSRTIRITVTDQSGAVNDARNVVVGAGNAAPVLTIGGVLTVGRSTRTAIGPSLLLATDNEDGPEDLRYQIGTLPSNGNLLLMAVDTNGDFTGSTILGGSLIEFTQADVAAGRVRYDHQGGSAVSDSFSVRVRDQDGSTTALSVLSITITGTVTDPTIALPSTTLVYTEQGAAVAVDPAAPTTLTVSISDADSPHYRRGELLVSLVDSVGADAATAGDTIGIRAANGQSPSPAQTGYICVVGSSVYIRHVASASALPTVGDNASPDQLIGTIDTTDNGVAGQPLRIALASTVVWTATDQSPNDDLLASESEVVTPTAVAQLIANLQLSHPGDAPTATTRFLKVTLSEATPNTASGSATRPVQVMPVNDPPVFTPAGPLVMDAVVGRPFIVTLVATDPDLPSDASLTYLLNNAPVAGVTLDAASGTITWIPTTTSPANLELVAEDDVGAQTSLFLTVTPLSGPTSDPPFIVSDPLVELGEGELIFHPFTVTAPTATAVAVQVVGDAPAGCVVGAVSLDQLSWTLTAPSVARPADGIYTFGLRIEATTPGGTEIGYQPITLVVVGLSGSN